MPYQTAGQTLATPEFKQKLASLYSYLAQHLGIRQTPRVKIVTSEKNANNPFGLTAHYDHNRKSVTLYITNRHDTDILRSFAHEIIHHWQNERGTLHPEFRGVNMGMDNSPKQHYAQENPWLRKREMEAYLFGNILFRDWQDEQRYGPPARPTQLPQPFDENLETNGKYELKNEVDRFVRRLVSRGVFGSYHRGLSTGDMNVNDFAEELSHKILLSIKQWTDTMNDRDDWESETNTTEPSAMIK